jgi:uncharacterized protein YaaW (UPF0174 family)
MVTFTRIPYAEAARRAWRKAASFYTAFIPVIIVIPTLVATARA